MIEKEPQPQQESLFPNDKKKEKQKKKKNEPSEFVFNEDFEDPLSKLTEEERRWFDQYMAEYYGGSGAKAVDPEEERKIAKETKRRMRDFYSGQKRFNFENKKNKR